MEEYIILIDRIDYCHDLKCIIYKNKDSYTAEISDVFYSDRVITSSSQSAFYVELSQYILNCGQIMSVIPLTEKHQIHILQSYLRIVQVRGLLLRLRKSLY